MTTFAPGTNRDYANAYNNWFWNGGYARGEQAPRRQDFGPDSNGLMPRPPADPYAGLEDLRDMYPGVSPDELRRLRDRMEEARRGDAADRYRQDMERYAPQYERNARAENQRLEEEMRRRQQQPQTPPVERRDPREWQDGRLAPPGSPVGVYPRQPIGGRPPDSGGPRLQPLPAPGGATQPNPYGQRPGMGDMASWASQQAAQAALPGRQITQYGPGSFGSAAGEPGGSSRQPFRPGMAQPIQPQSQGTPYGAPSPWSASSPAMPQPQQSGPQMWGGRYGVGGVGPATQPPQARSFPVPPATPRPSPQAPSQTPPAATGMTPAPRFTDFNSPDYLALSNADKARATQEYNRYRQQSEADYRSREANTPLGRAQAENRSRSAGDAADLTEMRRQLYTLMAQRESMGAAQYGTRQGMDLADQIDAMQQQMQSRFGQRAF